MVPTHMEVRNKIIGVLGATSLVGKALIQQLSEQGYHVIAFSRKEQKQNQKNIEWCTVNKLSLWQDKIADWVCVAPIWVLPTYFQALQNCGAKRVVVLSSTSIFTKENSVDKYEQSIVSALKHGEATLQEWAEQSNITWCVLRPTLIYGYGEDKNISEIRHFIRRFGFFPLFGEAKGLRQPVHADDVASACISALMTTNRLNCAYNISGAEVLPYREIVCRIFSVLGRKPRILTIPLFIFRVALLGIRLVPRYRHCSATMAERMNQDLVFDHSAASRDLAYSPLRFQLKDF